MSSNVSKVPRSFIKKKLLGTNYVVREVLSFEGITLQFMQYGEYCYDFVSLEFILKKLY